MVQISKKDTEKVLGLIYLWRNRHRRTGNVAAFLVVPPETFWITMQSQSKIGETPLHINNIRLSSSKNGESQIEKVLTILFFKNIINRITIFDLITF